jgi:alpha-galactosidase
VFDNTVAEGLRMMSQISAPGLAELAVAATPQPVSNTIDEVVPVSVLPEQSVGWIGTPA